MSELKAYTLNQAGADLGDVNHLFLLVHPKPESQIPKSETRTPPKNEKRNQKPETRNPESQALHQISKALPAAYQTGQLERFARSVDKYPPSSLLLSA